MVFFFQKLEIQMPTRASVFAGAIGCLVGIGAFFVSTALSDPLPPDTTYRPLPTRPFSAVKADDEAQKSGVLERQRGLLNRRYDLSDHPMPAL
jgi:cytochrome c peroxidase